MEKVKLTKEQAEAVAIRRNMNMFEESIKCHIRGQFQGDENKALAELSLDEFIRALYIGYEVEETFEVGDWVKVNWRDEKPSIHKVRRVNNTFVIIDGEQANTKPPTRITEHATPEEIAEEKQRRWWAKHGRKVWELRKGDVISDDDGEFHEVSNNNENEDGVSTMSGGFNQKYLEKYSKVICFAEDRKDVK